MRLMQLGFFQALASGLCSSHLHRRRLRSTKILRRDNLKDYHLNLIYVKLWLRGNSEAVVRSGIVLRDSRGSLLMLYLLTKWMGGLCMARFLKTKFGKEIDVYDVIGENGAPVENYTEFVGKKSSFRLLNRGSAKALDKVVELDGASFGSAAKGTGLEAHEFALSICEAVDMHGFTVNPGYKEWTRYSSESRQGHTPLHYQTLPS